MLARLFRIPCVLRHPHVRADRHSPAAAVLVRLQRGIDAEIRPPDVGGQDARVVRARLATVVERHRHCAAGARSDRRLELIRGRAGRVDVVVDDDWRPPREAAVRRLSEHHVRLARDRIPVLVREVEVAGIGRARREVLGDAAAETSVRIHLARRDGHGRDRHERPERAGVVD